VVVERATFAGNECFRIFLDRGVALSEPFNAHYKADWPLVRTFDGIFVDYGDQRIPVYLHNAEEPEVTFHEPAVYMLDKGASNYYHWMCEVFPRLWAQAAVPELLRFPMIVNDQTLTPFQHETLVSALGSAEMIAFPGRCVRFKRLYVSSFLSSGECAPRLRDWTARLFPHDDRESASPTRRLYISRGDASRRRVVNEEETWGVLERLGFERVVPGALSVAEQMALFAGAEAVVLPNGAAAANLAATPPGALVVEFQPTVLLNPGVWTVARAMDHRYGLVTTPDSNGRERDYFVDMTVDPGKLLRVVEAGLAERTA
jgi:capsular polysaccharide biosynthesis protein